MRGNAVFRDPGLTQREHGKKKDASFQVIVLVSLAVPKLDHYTR